ncbi:DUF1801 domain-containing protein [Streptomyces sp. DK15]|uniref:DUF1801 domain-containing protein n=1 Tax=Streptomyces sp. DK15 TaxID=2957499 RepID=UPI0029B63049|nr:DUF1801 domain-containing protein [Streptomyces sp. DK15]MDX2396290.1 DUF1801 domain-containing protein [Streptomyces sp. DK15]
MNPVTPDAPAPDAPAPDPVAAYLAAVPDARRPALTRLRELCRTELTGFDEVIAYGMPVYVRPGGSEGEVAWANQKQYVSVYLLRTDVRDAFAERLAGHDMGKSCLRFRHPDRIDFDLLRDLLRATAATPGDVC